MNSVGWSFDSLELVAVSLGPGSFTGLRIGMVTAKSMAFALNVPIVAVNTLEAIACSVSATSESSPERQRQVIKTVVNAQRKQLFAAAFQTHSHWAATQIGETQILGYDDWVDHVEEGDVISGSGLSLIANQIENLSNKVQFTIAPESTWAPDANVIGQLAYQRFLNQDFDDVWSVEPLYYRPSAAEEKLKLKK